MRGILKVIFILGVVGITACTKKSNSPLQDHTPAPVVKPDAPETTPAQESRVFSKEELNDLRSQSQLSVTELASKVVRPLQSRLFAVNTIGDQMVSRSQDFADAFDVYEIALLRLLQESPDSAEAKELADQHIAQFFKGCDTTQLIEFGNCDRFRVFRRGQATVDLLVLLALRAPDIETRYRYLITAYEFTNSLHHAGLADAYLSSAREFAQCLLDKKCAPANSQDVYLRHLQYLRLIARTFPSAATNEQLGDKIRALRILDTSNSNPLLPARKEFLKEFGALLVYKGDKLNVDLQSEITRQQARSKSVHTVLTNWKSPGTDPQTKAAHTARKRMILFEDSAIPSDEYLYLIEGMFLGDIDVESAQDLWQSTHQDRERFMETLIRYYEVRLVEATLKSNAQLKSIFDRVLSTQNSDYVQGFTARDSDQIQIDVWNPFNRRLGRLRQFYLSIRISSQGQPDSPLFKKQRDVDNRFDSISFNLNALTQGPMIWVMAHRLQELNLPFSYSTYWAGYHMNLGEPQHHRFTRDYLEYGMVPWFHFNLDALPWMSKQDALLSLDNVFRLGLLDLWELSASDFLLNAATYVEANTTDQIKDFQERLDIYVGNKQNLNTFMGMCYREAETFCDEADLSNPDTPQGYLRICKHRETLASFKNYRGALNTFKFDDLRRQVAAGAPTDYTRGENFEMVTTLQKGTAFYYFPYFKESSSKRNMHELVEITREDGRGRIDYFSAFLDDLDRKYPDDTDIQLGIKNARGFFTDVRSKLERLWALTLTWEDRIGDCYSLLWRGEQKREYQIIEKERETLLSIHKDIQELRRIRESDGANSETLKTRTAELNEKYRFKDSPAIKKMARLDEEFPAASYGFNADGFQSNSVLFYLRTVKYLSQIDPYTYVVLPADAKSLNSVYNRKINFVAYQENSEEFAKAALGWIPLSYVSWYKFLGEYLNISEERGKFLIRLHKLGRVQIDRKIWQEYGGIRPALFSECESTDASKICLEMNPRELIDDLRAQVQGFQLNADDLKWLPLMNLEYRIKVKLQLREFYCETPGGDSFEFDQCLREFEHFDIYESYERIATDMDDPPDGKNEVAAYQWFLPRLDYLFIATDFQQNCENKSFLLFRDGHDLLDGVNKYVTSRVNDEFKTRKDFLRELIARRNRDLASGNIVPFRLTLFEPGRASPPYLSASGMDDVKATIAQFHQDTADYFKEGRKCLPQ